VTLADFLILLVVATSTIMGFIRGFVREAVALVFWVAGFWLAWKFGPMIEPHLGGLLAGPQVRPWVGRLVVLVLVFLVSLVTGLIMQYFMRGIGLGAVDRVIGVLFGFARGLVLVGVAVIGCELLHLNKEDWWSQSKLVPYGETVGDWLRAMVGEKGEPWATLERISGVKVR
jgi:membrane protein required for colicin V production